MILDSGLVSGEALSFDEHHQREILVVGMGVGVKSLSRGEEEKLQCRDLAKNCKNTAEYESSGQANVLPD